MVYYRDCAHDGPAIPQSIAARRELKSVQIHGGQRVSEIGDLPLRALTPARGVDLALWGYDTLHEVAGGENRRERRSSGVQESFLGRVSRNLPVYRATQHTASSTCRA